MRSCSFSQIACLNMMLHIYAIITCCVAVTVAAEIPIVPRIIGGQVASSSEFPYMVSLQVNDTHLCGGTIIDNRTVLTAAHCLFENMTLVVGISNLSDDGERFKVVYAKAHEKYRRYYYDIALLKIEGFFTFGPKVRPVKLQAERVGRDVPCIACGWGKNNPTGNTSSLLQYVELKTLSAEICNRMYKPIDIDIGLQHVCTLAKFDVGVCLGDSGGPLLNLDEEQIGIVSFVRPCAVGFPDAFARISHFLSWINDNK